MARLTAKDLVAIIRAGKEAKVDTISAFGATIKYQGTEAEISASTYPIYPTINSNSTPIEASKPTQELDDNFLGLLDPAAYEERLLSGDLADEKA